MLIREGKFTVLKITKSMIMKKAWNIARKASKKFQDKVSKFFPEALKMAWAMAKKDNGKKTCMVPNWFFQKKFGMGFGTAYRKSEVLRETEKAVLVNSILGEMWCPKSILE